MYAWYLEGVWKVSDYAVIYTVSGECKICWTKIRLEKYFLTIEYFESSRNFELECGPAQLNLLSKILSAKFTIAKI